MCPVDRIGSHGVAGVVKKHHDSAAACRILGFLLVCLIGYAGQADARQQTDPFLILDLDLQQGDVCVARGVSFDGTWITGSCGIADITAGRRILGFRWSTSTDADLYELFEGARDRLFTYGRDISDDGRVIVGQATKTHETPCCGKAPIFIAARWGSDDPIELPTFDDGEAESGFRSSDAIAVSGDGRFIAGEAGHITTTSAEEGVLWIPDSLDAPIPLGSFDPSRSSFVADMTRDGRVVIGVSYTPDGVARPFRWTAQDGIEPIAPGGELDASNIAAISTDGETVVGYFISRQLGRTAYRWTEQNGLEILDTSARSFGEVVDVSGDGETVVGTLREDNLVGLVWREGIGAVPLRDLLTEMHGLDLSPWSAIRPFAISEDGSAVVGQAFGLDGRRVAFRAQLDFSCIAGVGKRGAVVGGGPADECADQIEVLTPSAGELLVVDNEYDITWRHNGIPDPNDSLVVSYSETFDASLGFALSETVLDTVAGDVEAYRFTAPNLSSSESVVMITKLRSGSVFFSRQFTFRGYQLVRSVNDTLQQFLPSKHGWPFSNSGRNLFPRATWWDKYDQFNYASGNDPVHRSALHVSGVFWYT